MSGDVVQIPTKPLFYNVIIIISAGGDGTFILSAKSNRVQGVCDTYLPRLCDIYFNLDLNLVDVR